MSEKNRGGTSKTKTEEGTSEHGGGRRGYDNFCPKGEYEKYGPDSTLCAL